MLKKILTAILAVIGSCLGMIVIAAIVLAITLVPIKYLWQWTVPDLFPKAVEQELVAREISWLTSFKIALVLAIFGAIAGIKGDKGNQ